MTKFLSIFLPTFFIVLFINQSSYGSCYESYCLSAAIPKVITITVIISGVIIFSMKSKK